MLVVYQKRTFIEIDMNLGKFSTIFSNMVFKENAYYWENEKKVWQVRLFVDEENTSSHFPFSFSLCTSLCTSVTFQNSL